MDEEEKTVKRKNVLKIVFSVLALVLLIITYVSLKNINEKKKNEEKTAEEILSIPAENVEKISFSLDEQTVTFEKQDDKWIYADDKNFPVDEEKLQETVDGLESITSDKELKDVDDLSEYGLKDNSGRKIEIYTTEGEKRTIQIGDMNTTTQSYYAIIDDIKDTVYMIESSFVSLYDGKLYDYAEAGTQLMHNGNVLTPVSIEPMESQKDGKTYTFNESGMTWKMMIYGNNATLIGVDPEGTETYFMFSEVDGKLSMVDRFGTPVDLNVPVESFGFKGVERLGSNRGYIYSRSIPLLKKNIILGAGADNFVLEFPQQDIKSKLEFLGDPYVIIDKPHNMFLQTGINDGCIALLVMIALFVLYVAQTIKRIFTDNNKYLQAVRYGLMAGCIAYMITGLTTDSVVSVAPVFWIMLGAGFGVNMIGIEKQEEKIK